MNTTTVTEIRFTTDRNGKRIAHRWSTGARRWISIGTERAQMMIATGAARQITEWV